MKTGFRAWGFRPAVRYFARRLLWRCWQALQAPDFWTDSAWRLGDLVRRGARIGWPSLVSAGLRVAGPLEGLDVSKRVGLAERVTFLTADRSLLPYFGCWRRAEVQINQHCQIAVGTIVCPGVSIGPRAAVGAFTVVDRDVSEDAVVIGRPLRVVGSFRRLYERRVEDIERRPHLYTESFTYGEGPLPWDDLPSRSQTLSVQEARGDVVTQVRNLIRQGLLWVWDQFQEPDDFRASEQRIYLMRKQGYRIGSHCYIDPQAIFDLRAGQISIGDHCVVGPYASITAHDGFVCNYTGRVRVQPVRILDGCSIGAGAVILPGVTIGPGSLVEPGSVIFKDVPPYTVVAGSPARPVASIWEWMDERRKEIGAHPEQYVAEPRIVAFPLAPRDASAESALGATSAPTTPRRA